MPGAGGGAWLHPLPPPPSSASAETPNMAVSLVSPGSNPSSGGAYYVPAWRYVQYRQMTSARPNSPPPPLSNTSPPRPTTPANGLQSLFPVAGSRLPNNLPRDPRQWSREDVRKWLLWCQDEFDLPPIDVTQFPMNGKALCLLMKSDFNERAPQCGDVLHNAAHLFVLQASVSDVESQRQRYDQHLRMYSYSGGGLLSSGGAESGAPPPNWATAWPFVSSDYHNVGHVINRSRFDLPPNGAGVESTVTLSPAPSTDSQSGGSPRRNEDAGAGRQAPEEEPGNDKISERSRQSESGGSDADSPPPAHCGAAAVNLLMRNKVSQGAEMRMPREMTLPPVPEQPVTNGRLLWDFLHQLLNDPAQRYVRCIAWKERDTGVFKIVDPHGLAQLWGMQKNHLNMNFDKMSRALRYYYRVNILKKVQGERHCYQFLRQPMELKACKQRALLSKYCGLQNKTGEQQQAAPIAIKCEGDA